MLDINIKLAGRYAAGPRPCNARQIMSMIRFFEKPAMIDHIDSHTIPRMYTGYPPYISATFPKKSRTDATTSEKALAGQTADASGMSNSSTNVGTMTVNPDMKYS